MAIQIPETIIIRIKPVLLCFANANFIKERSDRIGKTMAEHTESAEAKSESLIEKITEKIHGHGDSSSSSSDSESEQVKLESPSSVKTKIFRLFGRERPVHQVFSGGKLNLT
ncbi:hypothetical protein CsatA_009914 [Cannabis sativa]